MKTYTYYFSSINIEQGDVLNGYLFTDPIGGSVVYSLTADGGITDFADSLSYSLTAWDGNFFPYGFSLNDQGFDDSINIKGDYTIVFCPTGLNINPIKMVYDFGDNTPLLTVIQPLINSISFNDINVYKYGENFLSPKYQIISHNYYANSNSNYTASITAINTNLTIAVFNLNVDQALNSIYDFNDIHLLNSSQHISIVDNFIEIGDNKIVTCLNTNTAENQPKYPIPYSKAEATILVTENDVVVSTEENLAFILN